MRVVDPGWNWDDNEGYVQAIVVGQTVYVAGQVGVSDGEGIARGPRHQAERAFANMKEVLALAGARLDQVTTLTIYLTDMRNLPQVMQARTAAFGDHKPAQTVVQVAGLAHPALTLEVEAVARLDA